MARSPDTNDYHIAFLHRNHLGILSAPVFLSGESCRVWTNIPAFALTGSDTRVELGPFKWGLKAGNASGTSDQMISYAGANNDRDAILQRIGGGLPTDTESGYYLEDVNLDGIVKYAGAANDRDLVLQAIGGSTPTATVVGQVP